MLASRREGGGGGWWGGVIAEAIEAGARQVQVDSTGLRRAHRTEGDARGRGREARARPRDSFVRGDPPPAE